MWSVRTSGHKGSKLLQDGQEQDGRGHGNEANWQKERPSAQCAARTLMRGLHAAHRLGSLLAIKAQ